MRRSLALTAVAMLFVAACTSGDDESEAGDAVTTTVAATATTADVTDGAAETTTTTEAEPSGPSPGVTADTIKVGITYADLESIREVTNIDHGDYEGVYRILVDEINAAGGINGRMLEPVFAGVSPIGTAPAEEACLRLTQDEQVFAVLGFFQDEGVLCYIETQGTAAVGGRMSDALLARATVPWFTTDPGGDLEADAIRAFAAEGLLDEPFAVYGLDQALTDAALAVLEEAGVNPVGSAVLDAPDDDVFAQNQATAVIAERFGAAGAETVLLIGQAPLTWGNGVEPTDYRPRLLITDRDSAAAFVTDAAGRDLSVFEGSVWGGIADSFDEPVMQERCIAPVEAAGIEVKDPALVVDGEPNTYVAVFAACRYLTLFAAIAEAAGENLNYGTFQQAGEQLGELVIPGYTEPFTYGPVPSTDGDPVVSGFLFDLDERDWLPVA